ncbi:MAG: nucleotidyltransferase family protein [Phycisphaeraceae bacterium]|nr:nucleotidyltransferase family protein [Phycisphaeraceae bacterium]
MGLTSHLMAIERVQQRLRKVTAALDAAGVPYAVVGGNAVASWVGRVDQGATRATKDVDILVRRTDTPRVSAAITGLGFDDDELRDKAVAAAFIDPDEPSKKSGVHLVWAGERIRPSYTVLSPTVEEAVRDPDGFLVIDLPALVRMKLTSFRDIDRVHIADMLSVGLIDARVRGTLVSELLARLTEIEQSASD